MYVVFLSVGQEAVIMKKFIHDENLELFRKQLVEQPTKSSASCFAISSPRMRPTIRDGRPRLLGTFPRTNGEKAHDRRFRFLEIWHGEPVISDARIVVKSVERAVAPT
jgi:hypothetical protein